MDIDTITSFRQARTRDDLALAPGEVFMAGGTWLMSEPQPATSGFVDLTTMPWPEIEVTDAGLRVGATCTIARLIAWADGRATDLPAVPDGWPALDLFAQAANSLLASFKIWHTATVCGNICRSFTAAAMASLAAGLDAELEIWRPDGTERRERVSDFITGQGTNTLELGEVVRAVEFPAAALRSRAALRKVALAELGRSGSVVTGRLDPDGGAVFVVTASTLTPHELRYPQLPDAEALARDIAAAEDFYSDALGPADWRQGMAVLLAERIRTELST